MHCLTCLTSMTSDQGLRYEKMPVLMKMETALGGEGRKSLSIGRKTIVSGQKTRNMVCAGQEQKAYSQQWSGYLVKEPKEKTSKLWRMSWKGDSGHTTGCATMLRHSGSSHEIHVTKKKRRKNCHFIYATQQSHPFIFISSSRLRWNCLWKFRRALPPVLPINSQWCSSLILGRWLQQMPLPASGSQSIFCYHFFSSFFFSPSEFQSALCSAI